MGTDTDDYPRDYPRDYPSPLVVGDRNAVEVRVSHDLGDRTLVVVILLACVIGACGVVMGLNLAKQDQLDTLAREIVAKQQVTNNQNARIEAELKARKQ